MRPRWCSNKVGVIRQSTELISKDSDAAAFQESSRSRYRLVEVVKGHSRQRVV